MQNHGKSIHLKSTWLSSSRLRKRMSSIIPFKETNRRGIFFLWQKNSAFCSSAYAMACSSLLVESFLLSKKDNWTFNELCCWRYSASCCCASGELASPYSIISLYCFISGICSGCTLLFSKGTRNHTIFRHANFIGCLSADKIKMPVRKYFCFNIPVYRNMAEEPSCRSPYHEEYIQTSVSGNSEGLCRSTYSFLSERR